MGYVKLICFMLFSFICEVAFSSHLCPKDEALALLQFNHMFTTNNETYCYYDRATRQWIQTYLKTLSWNKSTDCCSWDGVYCDETTGQVTELNLTCSGLQGKFPTNSSLFQLSNLKRLDLSLNDFSGSFISPKFGELSSLTHLDLSRSSFTGVIPAEISHLSGLHVLRIGSSDLRFGSHNFELLLKNLTQLRELNLHSVNISSTFPLDFSSHLTTLYLPYTQLYGILPERVFHLSNLESLKLSFNPQLTVRFPTTKWNSSASLMYLYLSGVNATGRIPDSFGHLTSLRRLGMLSYNLSGSIPKPLWNLTNIEYLHLGYNHLEGPISDFFGFGKLRSISLRNNNFDGQLEFSSFNKSWTQLQFLDFSSNSLTGPIPSNVSGLQSLQSLRLSSNHLNGTIPSWIFSLPSLRRLNLSANHFSGKIQEFKSQTLSEVDVKQNQLQGPIPKSLLNQSGLGLLLLSHNNLSGQIASTICNLKILFLLDFGSNHLEGKIPLCLGEMSQLWILDLSNNSLSGTINTTFSVENPLEVIKFDGNKLKGKVPQSLINCTSLKILDLGNNELSDTFPKWLGALPNLQILNLRTNKFYGPIITDNLFAQIRVIDLSSNGFSGELPVSLFENFEAMKITSENSGTREYVVYSFEYTNSLIVTTKGLDLELPRVLTTEIIIDLSGNRFEGQIPSIIGDLIGLRTLNLSHNILEGDIPASLHNLSVLESLDLSSNKISGKIPQQLALLTSLEVLNLSHNHLVGCIPRGKQFDTFENSSYKGNDGLRGFPLSKDCGGGDGVQQTATPIEQEDEEEEEEDSPVVSWEAVLMGYGCGLVIGLSVIYIMLSTQYPAWFSRVFVELEHKIITRMQKRKKRN